MTPSLPTSTSGSTHGLSVVSSAAFSIGNAIKEGCCTLSRFVGKSQNLWKNVGVIAGLATVILAPVYLYKAIKTCRLIGRKPAENKMDSALHVVTNLQKTAETTGYFVMALNRIRTVVVRTFTWFTPFSIAMSVFSIPAIVTNVRSFIRTRNLIREMEAVEKNGVASGNTPLQTYRALLLHLEQKQAVNDDFISETFNVDKVKFADALVAIESDLANSDKKADGEKILNETLYLLKGRLKAKNIDRKSTRLNSSH